MKVCGIIAEYNPFHNGHFYHLLAAKKKSGCDYVICVMSGNFTQRGEAAIVDKWSRTKMALQAGVDIVIELPSLYVIQPAEWFAFGAVKILHALGVVTHLCFGSEIDDMRILNFLVDFYTNEPVEYQKILREDLKTGVSFPKSQANSLHKYFSSSLIETPIEIDEVIKAISSPNSILAIEYMKALRKLNSPITPIPISRIRSSYHSTTLKKGIASATAIRKSLYEKGLSREVQNALPSFSYQILQEEFANGKGPILPASFDTSIMTFFRKASCEEIRQLPDITEGLENRVKRFALESTNLNDMLLSIKTKRYVFTRLQRICLYALLGITRSAVYHFNHQGGPLYARLLGFSKKSLPLMKRIKKNSSIPFISKAADFQNTGDPGIDELFAYDILSTDIYSLAYPNQCHRKGGKDFTEKIIIVP